MTDKKQLDLIFANLWDDYTAIAPQALKIFNALSEKGEDVVNDHIALRTFQHPKINKEKMAQAFSSLGYEVKGEYHFEEKKLDAIHLEYSEDENIPKVFISELRLAELSQEAQNIIHRLVDQVSDEQVSDPFFSNSGRLWNVSHQDYLTLKKESDYAAWLAAMGFRANHFTVSFNHLKTFASLEELNQFIEGIGFPLNSSGGVIKGSSEVYLRQSSTMADQTEIEFSDGKFLVTSCYYEFAERFPFANGKLYQGFVAKSADKIFESTNTN